MVRKTSISNPLIRARTCAYQGVRNINFSKNFACILNECPLNRSSLQKKKKKKKNV